ncbi:MAG: hypothetical protein ACYS47_15745 [Planctomycetota bacterium]|jgi:hypothetical protein
MFSRVLILACALAVFTGGCKEIRRDQHYFESFAVKKKIPAKKSVGIIYFDRDGVTQVNRGGSMMVSSAVAYLFQKGGYPVMVLDGRKVGGVVLSADRSLGAVAASRRVAARGASTKRTVLKPSGVQAPAVQPGAEPGSGEPGAAERNRRTFGFNEFFGGVSMVEGSLELFDAYLKDWQLDYVLLLWNPGPYSYRAQVVELESRQIIADIFMTGSHYGWFSKNSFTLFEKNDLAANGMRYDDLTSYEKAMLVFIVRVIEKIATGAGITSGGGETELDGW